MRQDHKTRGDRGGRQVRRGPGSPGFTLIELVVAMVIVAILAAIAIPSYTSYVRKGRRTDAKSAVLDLASLEERYFSLNNKYSLTATDFGYTAFPASIGSGSNPDYQLNVTLPNAGTSTQQATYSITATAYGDQVNDTQCNQFTLTSAGIQGSYTSASAANSEPGTCW